MFLYQWVQVKSKEKKPMFWPLSVESVRMLSEYCWLAVPMIPDIRTSPAWPRLHCLSISPSLFVCLADWTPTSEGFPIRDHTWTVETTTSGLLVIPKTSTVHFYKTSVGYKSYPHYSWAMFTININICESWEGCGGYRSSDKGSPVQCFLFLFI